MDPLRHKKMYQAEVSLGSIKGKIQVCASEYKISKILL